MLAEVFLHSGRLRYACSSCSSWLPLQPCHRVTEVSEASITHLDSSLEVRAM